MGGKRRGQGEERREGERERERVNERKNLTLPSKQTTQNQILQAVHKA